MTHVPEHVANPTTVERAPHVAMPWLVRLRWASVLALAAAAVAAHVFWRVRLPVWPLVGLLAALALTNAALAFQLRSPRPKKTIVGVALLLDAGLLTGILYLVGGPLNPFGIVYLVGITAAAVSLGYRWAIALGVASNIAYGLTFFHHRPLEFIDPSASGGMLTLHLSGCGWRLRPRPGSSPTSSAVSRRRWPSASTS
ncbi:MAG TPA: hypothetical protein VMF13_15020 [Luteitalea sp.]|nr:hypothetical protein [Luteitalea sp.]